MVDLMLFQLGIEKNSRHNIAFAPTSKSATTHGSFQKDGKSQISNS